MSKGNVAAQRARYRERYPEKVRTAKALYRERRRTAKEWVWCADVWEVPHTPKGVLVVGRGIDAAVARWAKQALGPRKLEQLATTGFVGVKRDEGWYDYDYLPGCFLRVTFAADEGRRRRVTWWDVAWMGDDPAALDAELAASGCRLTSFHGPGAVAAAWMRKHKVKDHLPPVPEQVEDAARRAYFGGDIRCFRVGVFDGPVQKYDLNSAYAWALSLLPSFQGGWRQRHASPLNLSRFGICRVRWNVGPGRSNPLYPVTPFPWRGEDGLVCYPPSGDGWYWSPLVEAAALAWGSQSIRVQEMWEFLPDSPCSRPFEWLEQVYDLRRQAEGSHLADVLKVAMSAVYGKLVQEPGKWDQPYHHLAAAGLCTALVRSKVLGAATARPEAVISSLTDCLWLRGGDHLGATHPQGLGQWRHTALDGFSSYSPNYYCERHGQQWERHAAGVTRWDMDATPYRAFRTILWTPALCQAHGRWDLLGEEVEEGLELSSMPQGGFAYPDDDGETPCWNKYDPARAEEYRTVLSAPYRRLDK